MNETAQLAKFTAEMEFAKLQPQAVLMAKQCLLDWLGVALRGAHEEPARILRETALKMCGTGESTVFDGGSRRVDPVSAALVNGAASHTLDFDDLHNPSIIHLATVVIPAAVAVAEACHKAAKPCLRQSVPGMKPGRVPVKPLYRNLILLAYNRYGRNFRQCRGVSLPFGA